MTVAELVFRLNNLDNDDWDVHIEDSASWKIGNLTMNRGASLVLTNGGVRTEITFDKPVRNSRNEIIQGRWQR